ncbi:S8 family serine peptidase [Streptomyces sp. NPDC052811]|uniref:S8 family serine peptidase n=1 Tax=Streptomyces sp. NPDC052811 TaxID=3155731 RepID=UPI00344505A6
MCSTLAVWAITFGLAPHVVADGAVPKQWYLDAMHASEMWKVSTGEGIKVAVVDSGVNPDTPSLRGQVLSQDVPTSAAYGATKDYNGHGTTMAELIAGTGRGGGLEGLAPGAKIIPVRVALSQLKDAAELKLTLSVSAGIRAAADTDAKIINMSFGGSDMEPDVENAVRYAESKGKLLFAATGNGGGSKGDFLEFPAAYPGVVSVAAADESGTVAKFSQSGDYVDLASPGLKIPAWCDATFQEYCKGEGTSQASAIASASAALIWSAHPSWTANQVLRVMIETASRTWDKNTTNKFLGHGLIRPRLVLEQRDINPGPPDVDPLSGDSVAGGAAASGRPGSGAAKGPAPQDPAPKAAADAKPVGGSGQLWGAVGIGAGVLVIGGGALAVLRARRRRT